ncbi:MAG TPA: CBS domain-containing protein [Candidatus Polarisedimenticolaceae bacterium]|nr:CBS domain-containing protein [Candidatus Polarisedimenticolaceae bacterium]
MPVLESPTTTRVAADVMTTNVMTCSPDVSLAEAAHVMWECDLGCLVVVRPGEKRPIGMLTDRDVCIAAARHSRRLAEIPVHTVMTRVVHSVGPEASVEELHALLRERQIRRVPVVDRLGHLEGVVGLSDLVRDVRDEEKGRELIETLREVMKQRTF